MTLAQERLVFAWLLAALCITALIGAQRYPWLYFVAVPIVLLGLLSDDSSYKYMWSLDHMAENHRESNELLERHPWLWIWYAVVGLIYAGGLAAITTRAVDYRIPNDVLVILGLIAPLLLPITVARQWDLYEYYGTQSNPPVQPTPTAPADRQR